MKFLLLIAFFFTLSISCKVPFKTYQKFLDNELNHYGVQKKDTILDFGVNSTFSDALLSTIADSLHFYVWRYNQSDVKVFLQFSNQLKGNYKVAYVTTASLVREVNRSIPLRDNSVNKIIIRNSLDYADKLDEVIAEVKRILKPEGSFIIVQDKLEGKDKEYEKKGLPIPNEEEIVKYVESRGFRKIKALKSRTATRSGDEQVQLHFQKT